MSLKRRALDHLCDIDDGVLVRRFCAVAPAQLSFVKLSNL